MKPQGSTSNRGWLVAANKVFWLKELPQIPCRGRNCQLDVDEVEEGERGGEGNEGGGEGRRRQRRRKNRRRNPGGISNCFGCKTTDSSDRGVCIEEIDSMRMTINTEFVNVLTEELP